MASFDPYWSYPPEQRLKFGKPIITEIVTDDEEEDEDGDPRG